MDYSKTAVKLINELGGTKNIKSVVHCMTRLRFVLIDESIVDDNKVKSLPGVLGIMKKGGQYQVIIGNEVSKCYDEIMKNGSFKNEMSAPVKEKKKLTPKSIFNNVLDVIAGSMTPILPAIIGCGMIKLLNIVLSLLGVPDTNTTYQFLVILGDAGFYFLPILLAYTSSKKFNCSPILAMTIVAVLVHPDLIALFGGEAALDFLGIPVTAASYSSSVIPAILITWIMSYVERFVEKITPGWTKNVFKPMLILLIMLPVGLIVLAPLGAIIGEGVQSFLAWLQSKSAPVTLMLFSGFMPFLVMTGMHYAFVPGSISDIGTLGYDTLLIPAMLASNLAQGAAALAVMLRTKNKNLKSIGGASSASALVAGITEPALYGITLRLKKPLIAACIGSGIAGLFIGIFNVRAYTFATPALISIIQFINPDGGSNFFNAIIAAALSIIITLGLTILLGWDDPVEDMEESDDNEHRSDLIESPLRGAIIPLEDVNDETFSTGVLGSGFAVIPEEGKVYAPFDGECSQMFDTLHAMGLKSKDGVELLVHVGLETVSLGGEPFKAHIASGDTFSKGDLLLEFDIDKIKNSGCEITTPVVVTNSEELGGIKIESNRILIGGKNHEVSE